MPHNRQPNLISNLSFTILESNLIEMILFVGA